MRRSQIALLADNQTKAKMAAPASCYWGFNTGPFTEAPEHLLLLWYLLGTGLVLIFCISSYLCRGSNCLTFLAQAARSSYLLGQL